MDRHLLILDLDETLMYGAAQRMGRDCDFHVGPYFVYRRPHLFEFFSWASQWFDLAVWSSASGAYVDAVVERILLRPPSLRFAWARDKCTQRYNAAKTEYYWVKKLDKVERLGFPIERILMIDDSPEKLEDHNGNHLRLRPFLGNTADTELIDVLPFLKRLSRVSDIRAVEKRFWRWYGNW